MRKWRHVADYKGAGNKSSIFCNDKKNNNKFENNDKSLKCLAAQSCHCQEFLEICYMLSIKI